jgi:hypothetical protein
MFRESVVSDRRRRSTNTRLCLLKALSGPLPGDSRMPSRLPALVVLVAVVLSGCVAGPLGAGAPESPDSTPSVTPTSTPTECTEQRLSVTDPARDNVNPSPYPDRPANWTGSTVREYVVAFEQAWSRNQRLREATKRVTVSVSDVAVTRTGYGYRLDLTSQTNTWYGGPAEGNRTATIVHGDGAYVPVRYVVTDGRLVRSEGRFDSTPTGGPQSGRTLRCWDDD